VKQIKDEKLRELLGCGDLQSPKNKTAIANRCTQAGLFILFILKSGKS
jgi:hypothetical protein